MKNFKLVFYIFISCSLLFLCIDIIIATGNPIYYHRLPNTHIPSPIQIATHNILILFLMIIVGNLTFGASTVLFLIYNILFTSWKILTLYDYTGNKIGSILSVMGHGPIELLAISFSADISLISLKCLLSKISIGSYINRYFKLELTKLYAALFLFSISSLLESYFSPQVMKFFYS